MGGNVFKKNQIWEKNLSGSKAGESAGNAKQLFFIFGLTIENALLCAYEISHDI